MDHHFEDNCDPAQPKCERCGKENCMCSAYRCVSHYKFSHHSLKFLENQHLKEKQMNTLRSELKKYTQKIAEDTQKVISSIKGASHLAIYNLKKTTRNIENLSNVLFDTFRITFQLEHVRSIREILGYSPQEELEELSKDVISKDQAIKKMQECQEKLIRLEMEKERQELKKNRMSERVIGQKDKNLKLLFEINEKENIIKMKDSKIAELENIINNTELLRKMIKEHEEKIKPIKGKAYEEFQGLSLKQKRKIIEKKWKFVFLDRDNKDFLLSNDGECLFQCKE